MLGAHATAELGMLISTKSPFAQTQSPIVDFFLA